MWHNFLGFATLKLAMMSCSSSSSASESINLDFRESLEGMSGWCEVVRHLQPQLTHFSDRISFAVAVAVAFALWLDSLCHKRANGRRNAGTFNVLSMVIKQAGDKEEETTRMWHEASQHTHTHTQRRRRRRSKTHRVRK